VSFNHTLHLGSDGVLPCRTQLI